MYHMHSLLGCYHCCCCCANAGVAPFFAFSLAISLKLQLFSCFLRPESFTFDGVRRDDPFFIAFCRIDCCCRARASCCSVSTASSLPGGASSSPGGYSCVALRKSLTARSRYDMLCNGSAAPDSVVLTTWTFTGIEQQLPCTLDTSHTYVPASAGVM